MKHLQFISITPDELINKINEAVSKQLKNYIPNNTKTNKTEYLTRNDVAEMFSVDVSTIHNWVNKGYLKPYQIGGRVYFIRHEIEKSLIQLDKG